MGWGRRAGSAFKCLIPRLATPARRGAPWEVVRFQIRQSPPRQTWGSRGQRKWGVRKLAGGDEGMVCQSRRKNDRLG